MLSLMQGGIDIGVGCAEITDAVQTNKVARKNVDYCNIDICCEASSWFF